MEGSKLMKNLCIKVNARSLYKLSSVFFLSILLVLYNNCTGSFIANENFESVEGPVNPGPDNPPVDSLLKSSFVCRDQTQANKSGTHYLSKKQYLNTIEDLFGTQVLTDASAAISSIPIDAFDEESRQRISSLDANAIQAYFSSAQAIATSVTSNTTRRNTVFGSCASQAILTQLCVDGFMTNFALRILRRPLSISETSFLNSIYAGAGTNIEKLHAMLSYLLQSPFFIWRLELGTVLANSDNFNLSEYESATKLAFALTDSTPDVALLDAVKSGKFKTPDQHKTQAERLILTTRGKAKITDLIMHWSHSDNSQDLSSLPSQLTAGINMTGLEQAMVQESKKFLDYIVFQTEGTFQDLLKSKVSFASHTGLAKIYNHAPVVANTPVEFTERRQGLLMRAPFMTWTGPRTNLIKRGVDFQKRILCNVIPSPNVDIADDRDVDAFTPAQQLEVSNRDNIAHQTRSPVCMGCHSAINPVGFAFEAFDSLGRIRNQELIFDLNQNFYRYINVDSRTSLARPRASELPIQDAFELINYVADSSQGHECFVRNAYRYITDQSESVKDDCHLDQSFELLANSDAPIKDVIIKLVLNENLIRKIAN